MWVTNSAKRHIFDQDAERMIAYAAEEVDETANAVRVCTFGLGHFIETEQVMGKKVHRVKVCVWSQARCRRRLGNAHQEHAREVIEHVTRIMLAGDSVVISLLLAEMPQEMVPMVEVMKLDIHARDRGVMTATLAKLQEREATTAGKRWSD